MQRFIYRAPVSKLAPMRSISAFRSAVIPAFARRAVELGQTHGCALSPAQYERALDDREIARNFSIRHGEAERAFSPFTRGGIIFHEGVAKMAAGDPRGVQPRRRLGRGAWEMRSAESVLARGQNHLIIHEAELLRLSNRRTGPMASTMRWERRSSTTSKLLDRGAAKVSPSRFL